MITSYEEAILMGVNTHLAAAAFIDTCGVYDAQKQIDNLLGIKLNYYKKMDTTTNPNYPANTTGLDFTEAMSALADGFKVRLPEWTGYWFQRGKDIAVFSRTGDILDTPNWKHYAMREDWEIVTTGLGFDFALLALKAGKSVRCGLWGEGTYITLQTPDVNSKMSVPYLYGTSSHGTVPYVPDSIELFATNWEIAEITQQVVNSDINLQSQQVAGVYIGPGVIKENLGDQSV